MEPNKILVVDDEAPISSYLERKLSKLGYEVMLAKDGEEALEKTKQFVPDLILLDVKLPKINGVEVCRRLKSDGEFANVRIVMLSARAQAEEIEAGLSAGADKYLCKPVGFPDILKEIEKQLRS